MVAERCGWKYTSVTCIVKWKFLSKGVSKKIGIESERQNKKLNLVKVAKLC